MKTASYAVMAVRIMCPHCGAIILSNRGSEMLTGEDIARLDTRDRRVMESCGMLDCRKSFRLPSVVDQLV